MTASENPDASCAAKYNPDVQVSRPLVLRPDETVLYCTVSRVQRLTDSFDEFIRRCIIAAASARQRTSRVRHTIV